MDFQNPPAFTLGGPAIGPHQDDKPSELHPRNHTEQGSRNGHHQDERSDTDGYHLPPEMQGASDSPQPWSKAAITALIVNACAFPISFIPLVNIMAAVIAVPGLAIAVIALITTRDAGSRRGKPMAIIALALALATLILTGILWFVIRPTVPMPFAH